MLFNFGNIFLKHINLSLPGDPRKCDELIFRITSIVVMIELNGKEAEFYKNFTDINDLKIRLLVTTQRLN